MSRYPASASLSIRESCHDFSESLCVMVRGSGLSVTAGSCQPIQAGRPTRTCATDSAAAAAAAAAGLGRTAVAAATAVPCNLRTATEGRQNILRDDQFYRDSGLRRPGRPGGTP